MRVSIWDLDYYHSKTKKNCFNPDIMKISSYHKQLGDSVNFILNEFDIRRPYDVYYVIKEHKSTPNPPLDFFTNNKVKWYGKAFKTRINWKMSDAMLGCRPDYLLYPEMDTSVERAEHIRLFNNSAQLLPIAQDFTNAFKRKKVIVTDTHMWFANKKDLVIALKRLSEHKNILFLEPIWLQKLVEDEELKQLFLKLKLSNGITLTTYPIEKEQIENAKNFILEIKKQNPSAKIGPLYIDYFYRGKLHWESRQYALDDFNFLTKEIIEGKKNKMRVSVRLPQHRLEFPYFHLFQLIEKWTKDEKRYMTSWLEFITRECGLEYNSQEYFIYWNHPELWSETFRDIMRQTWTNKDFLLTEWNDKTISEVDINWKLWEEEFKYGI